MKDNQGIERSAVTGCLLGAALAAAIAPASARAEDAAGADNPTITVRGERHQDANPNANPDAPYKVERSQNDKYTEPLRDTPKSVVVIPKEVIEDVGATSFRDVARTTPGVTLGTGEGGNAFGDRIFIRGFEARNDIYIDGMRDPGVTSREVFALEQIEIVKGPSSAFGGRGTTGGAVGLESKRALDRNFVIAEGGIGTENYYRATLDVNQQLSEGLAVRINGLYHNADVPGRDFVDSERYGVAAALNWNLAPNFTLDADFYLFRSDGMSDYGHPFDPATGEPVAVDADNFYGVVGRDFLKNSADIGTVKLTWEPASGLKLTSQTRYGKVGNQYVVSVPRAPRAVSDPPSQSDADLGFVAGQLVVNTGTPQRNATTEYLANITQAQAEFATGPIQHTLVVGGEYAHEEITNRRWAFPATVEDQSGNVVSTPGGFVRDLYNPDPVLGFTIPAVLDTSATPTVTTVESWSLFALDTIKFSPHLQLLLGGRYDSFDIRSVGATGAGAYDVTSTTSFFNWQASLLYKPFAALSLYASYSTSSNPSGEQLDATSPTYGGCVGGNVCSLEPERNKAIEVGAKWEVAQGKLLLTAAAFRIDKSNAREQTSPGVYELVGELRSQGFELGFNGNITSRLAVFGGYSYLDARIRNSAIPANVGRRFANVPEHNFSLLTTYRLTDALTIGGQAYYRSRVYGEATTVDASIPGYWKFDAVARYRITSKLEARVNVLNITDKRYYDAIYRSGSPFSYVAPGRSATFTLAAQF